MNLSKYQLDKLRGYPLDDEDVKYVIDVFGPMLAEHGIHFCKNISPTADEREITADESTFIAQTADKLIQHKWEINNTFRLKNIYCMSLTPAYCHENRKDALFIAKESFQLAGYNPDNYNFAVVYDKVQDEFLVTITVK